MTFDLLSTFDLWRAWPAPPGHIVYQMRNQLCQLLLQQTENLLRAVQAAAAGELFQAKSPVKYRAGPEIPHRALDRVGRAVQQLPIGRVDRPPQLVDPQRMLLQQCLG